MIVNFGFSWKWNWQCGLLPHIGNIAEVNQHYTSFLWMCFFKRGKKAVSGVTQVSFLYVLMVEVFVVWFANLCFFFFLFVVLWTCLDILFKWTLSSFKSINLQLVEWVEFFAELCFKWTKRYFLVTFIKWSSDYRINYLSGNSVWTFYILASCWV